MIPGSTNTLLLASAGAAEYQIERSVRFNSADSAYLSRTPSVAGNRKTWTWAGWVKRSGLGTERALFGTTDASANTTSLTYKGSTDTFQFYQFTSGSYNGNKITTPVYRDTSAWMHVVAVWDTTNATASDRMRLYVNGERVTNFGTSSDPSLNSDSRWNQNVYHSIGQLNGSYYFSGYLADIHFIDGQALDPTSFGEFDANGVWQPKAYEGSYGTNGFHLPFSDNSTAAALGTDTSGNSNTWTVNNISVAAGAGNDSLVDTPTNYGTDTGAGGEVRGNYATLNPLDAGITGLSNGNLDAASANAYPTIIPGSGQWYYEVNSTGYTWDGTRANWTPRAGSHNFGQRVWASSAPSGFKALCTTNLPEPTIADGSTAMDVVLDTGANILTAAQGAIGGSADLLWIKDRANANNHQLIDTVRGGTATLQSNTAAAETTYSAPSGSSVAWSWDAGSSTVTNNDGTITSQVRANPSAGFSVVTYSGNGVVGSTIGHGLNAVPSMLIVKPRTGVTAHGWRVYHASTGNTKYFNLNLTNGAVTYTDWNSTTPTSSVFTVNGTPAGTVNVSGSTYVAYCFAPVEGYSAFGTYTGNGSADGPFVYLGFRPALVLLKMSSSTGNWTMLDYQREGYNVDNDPLYPNLTNAESTTDLIDITSNGFKVRTADASVNTNAGTYIYAAFAENPFKTARAR